MELNKVIYYFLSKIKDHFLFLIIFIPVMIYTFQPIVKMNFMDWDWLEIEYLYHVKPPSMHPLVFYLITPYGTAYALLGLAHLFFGSEMTPYYLLNIFLRGLGSFTIYLFASWWTKDKIIGIISGLFYGVSIIGIQNTIWVIQFPAYVGPILLCLSLYSWKKFHNSPSNHNMKLSVVFAGLAYFISHIRIYGLPFVLLAGDIYYFFKNPQNKFLFIRLKHIVLVLIVCLLPLWIFYLILQNTNNQLLTANVLNITSPIILIQTLFNGYPSTLFTFFMFIGYLFFPPFFYPGSTNIYFLRPEVMMNFFTSLMIGCSLMFLFVNLFKKRFLITLATSIAVMYPLVFNLSLRKLDMWESASLLSTLVGGTFFILITLTILVLQNYNRRVGELGLFAIIILVIHLILPWAAFPIPQNNVQSASDPISRYYLIPVLGISILWGIMFSTSLKLIQIYWQSKRSLFKKILFPGNYMSITVTILILYLLFMHVTTTHNYLVGRTAYLYKDRLEQLWKIVKPNFESIADKQKERVVYFEGINLSPNDINIVEYYMKHKLTSIGFHTSHRAHTVFFTSNKKTVSSLIHNEAGSITILGLSQPFDLDNFLAYRFEKDKLIDIRKEIIYEVQREI